MATIVTMSRSSTRFLHRRLKNLDDVIRSTTTSLTTITTISCPSTSTPPSVPLPSSSECAFSYIEFLGDDILLCIMSYVSFVPYEHDPPAWNCSSVSGGGGGGANFEGDIDRSRRGNKLLNESEEDRILHRDYIQSQPPHLQPQKEYEYESPSAANMATITRAMVFPPFPHPNGMYQALLNSNPLSSSPSSNSSTSTSQCPDISTNDKFETNTFGTLTHVLPLVCRRFRDLCFGSDVLWVEALTRLVESGRNKGIFWEEELRALVKEGGIDHDDGRLLANGEEKKGEENDIEENSCHDDDNNASCMARDNELSYSEQLVVDACRTLLHQEATSKSKNTDNSEQTQTQTTQEKNKPSSIARKLYIKTSLLTNPQTFRGPLFIRMTSAPISSLSSLLPKFGDDIFLKLRHPSHKTMIDTLMKNRPSRDRSGSLILRDTNPPRVIYAMGHVEEYVVPGDLAVVAEIRRCKIFKGKKRESLGSAEVLLRVISVKPVCIVAMQSNYHQYSNVSASSSTNSLHGVNSSSAIIRSVPRPSSTTPFCKFTTKRLFSTWNPICFLTNSTTSQQQQQQPDNNTHNSNNPQPTTPYTASSSFPPPLHTILKLDLTEPRYQLLLSHILQKPYSEHDRHGRPVLISYPRLNYHGDINDAMYFPRPYMILAVQDDHYNQAEGGRRSHHPNNRSLASVSSCLLGRRAVVAEIRKCYLSPIGMASASVVPRLYVKVEKVRKRGGGGSVLGNGGGLFEVRIGEL